VCLNLREVTVLWQFNAHSDGKLDVMVLQRHQPQGVMNNVATEAKENGPNMSSGNGTYHIYFGTVTLHFHHNDRLLAPSYLDTVSVDLSE
jgi:hypothetical protein